MPETDILEQNKSFITILLLAVPVLLQSCGGELSTKEKKRVQSALSDSLLATTETWNVDIEIIENGLKKVHLTASYSAVYSNETRIKGPVHIEVFDSTGAVKTRVNANRAVFHTDQAIFELFGDVDVKSSSGRTLHSEYLKWDRSKNHISTPEFVIITTANDSLAGTGFRGTVDLTQYTIIDPSGKVVLN